MSEDLTRRQLLGRLGAGAGLAAVAGCPGDSDTETPPPTPTDESPEPTETPADDTPEPTQTPEGEQVIDLQEAGADPEGEESIIPVLESVPTTDVVLSFPPGEYMMDDSWLVQQFENVTIEGPEATIRPAPEVTGPLFGMGSRNGATDLTITDLTFDVSGENRGPRPIQGMVADDLHVEGVDVVGQMSIDHDCLRFDVVGEDGTGLVRNVSVPDGSVDDYRITGLYVGEAHRGHLTIEDCHIANFLDNGIYASPARGRVDVIGGRYENNGISNVRVSGPATVRDVHVRCDRDDRDIPNMRGIRLREGKNVVVEDCEIEMEAVTGSDGAITCAPPLQEATIRNTTVDIGADDVAALWAKQPNDGYDPDRENPLRIENFSIVGEAATGETIRVHSRPDPLFEDVTICQPGDERDGLRLIDAGRAILSQSQVAVGGDPLINEGPEVNRDGSTLRQINGDEDC